MKITANHKIITVAFCLILILMFTLTTYASTSLVTYGDCLPTSSYTQNLIRYASNYNTFYNSDYVAVRSGQNEYYIFWGSDISLYDNSFGGSELEYVRYARNSSTSDYYYTYGTTDSLAVDTEHQVTSNVLNLGLRSELADEFHFNYYWLIGLSFVIGISAFMAYKGVQK